MTWLRDPYEMLITIFYGKYVLKNDPSRHLMQSISPTLSLIIALLVALFGLTGFGIYTAFGPPSKRLDDPFDEHDD